MEDKAIGSEKAKELRVWGIEGLSFWIWITEIQDQSSGGEKGSQSSVKILRISCYGKSWHRKPSEMSDFARFVY